MFLGISIFRNSFSLLSWSVLYCKMLWWRSTVFLGCVFCPVMQCKLLEVYIRMSCLFNLKPVDSCQVLDSSQENYSFHLLLLLLFHLILLFIQQTLHFYMCNK